jgi:hypothetical protein
MNLIEMRQALPRLVGKTIARVVVKEGTNPQAQVFVIFTDRTYYEFYGDMNGAAGIDRGDIREVLAYMAPQQAVVFSTDSPCDGSHLHEELVTNIDCEPERFFLRPNITRRDAKGDLDDVRVWNPGCAGVILVWRNPSDGRLKLIDGHRRLALARRLNVALVWVLEITAHDAEATRAMGAQTDE